MKRLKLLFTIIALCCGTVGANAQLKLAYINVQDLIASMPEIKAADQSVQDMANTLQNQLQAMTTEYQTKVTDFQAKEKHMSDSMKEDKYREIQDLENRITSFQQKAQQDLTKKQEEVYAPLLAKAEDAIKAVAKQNSISYVFDSSKGGILLDMPASDDILSQVKKYMNIQ